MASEDFLGDLLPFKPETNRLIAKITIVLLIVFSFVFRKEFLRNDLNIVFSILFSILITGFSSRKSKIEVFNFNSEYLLFTDFQFNRSVLRILAEKAFFLSVLFFWFFVLNSLFTSYDLGSFLISFLSAFGILYFLRLILELGISLSIVAENSQFIKENLFEFKSKK